MASSDELESARVNTRAVYERRASEFDRVRSTSDVETRWFEAFVNHLPRGATVLDLGCGSGAPIAAALTARGFAVTGVDYSAPMLELARSRLPDEEWVHGDMRDLDLGRTFDGVISWDGFFHLSPDEQRVCLGRVANHVSATGVLLLTVGPDAGEVTGRVGGELVYHASLSSREYRRLLDEAGFSEVVFVAEDGGASGRSVLLATRS